MGILYVVGTPIGNLGDMTIRAKEMLDSVAVIAAEDTRVSKKLLAHFDIHTPMLAYHAHSGSDVEETICTYLESGEDVALISDAGTPAISDPGSQLVRMVRSRGFEVQAVPGPSALSAALSIAGIPTHQFVFLGFVPHKKGRQSLFQEIAASKRTVVFYESPHRIMKTLISLEEVLDDQVVSVFRELTKVHEEVVQGNASEVHEYFEVNADHIRGEFVVAVSRG